VNFSPNQQACFSRYAAKQTSNKLVYKWTDRQEMRSITLLKRFSFWLFIISMLICLGDYLGSGIANIVLVRINPFIDAMIFTEPFQSWMIDMNSTKWVANSALISLRYPAYLIHLGTFFSVGLLIDYFIHKITIKQRWRDKA
jgi:hypothetical protein